MPAVFVVLIRVVFFFIIATYNGEVPVAEQVILKRFNDRTAEAGDNILGKTIEIIKIS